MQVSAQEDCFSNISQDFLICTTVHKARHLGVFTSDTMVRVTFGREQKHTKIFSNSENPFYNEYFVFEVNCTLHELLRQSILYEVRKCGACCNTVTIGEMVIDINSVWIQPNRYFFKKWGRLELPLASKVKATENQQQGYLQIDLAIITESTNTDIILKEVDDQNLYDWEIDHNYDDIKKNMLTNIDPNMECNIRYNVSFFNGYFTKKGDYYIQFSFHPFRGKTRPCKSTMTPTFNEYVSFTWTYPSLSQTFLLQIFIYELLQWKCLAEYELHFNEIAFNDKPKLGPTFLHFYDNANSNSYVGRILLEICSECLTENEKQRELIMGIIPPLQEKRYWHDEIFMLGFLAIQGDFLHGNYNSYKITMKFAEYTSDTVECFAKSYYPNRKHFNKLKYFKHKAPFKAISITADLPDNRHKYDSDYFLQEILDFLKSEIEAFKLYQLKYTNRFQMQNKCLRSIILSLQTKIKDGISKKRFEYTSYNDPTPWDTNRLVYLLTVLRLLPEQLRAMVQRLRNTTVYTIEHTMDDVVQQLLGYYKDLSNLSYTTRVQDDWPELFLMMTSGNKEVAICHINPKIYLNTPADKEISTSNACWCVKHFIFKDINCKHSCDSCGCVSAVVEGCIAIIAEAEQNDFLEEILDEWNQPENFYYSPTVLYTNFKCRVFLHQAKIRPGHDKTGLCDAFVRIFFNGHSAETSSQPATLSPTWNIVISFEGMKLPGAVEWYELNPPVVVIELYDLDKHTADDYLGCGLFTTAVINTKYAEKSHRDECEGGGSYLKKYQQLRHLSPPPLKWVPISSKGTVRAEILISAELVECLEDTGYENEADEPNINLGIPMCIRPILKNFVVEVVFAGLRNYIKSFYGRHRIKIMMGDLQLTSGLSTSRMRNSVNFLVLYASGVVTLPEQLEYWPAIITTDVVVTPCSEKTLGAMILPNSKRYLQRDKFVMCMTNEVEVNSPHTTVLIENLELGKLEVKPKRNFFLSLMKEIFWPFLIRKPKKRCFEPQRPHDDSKFTWWTKFYNSTHFNTFDFNPCKHTLTIYNKELEKLPEFDYMHDWAEPIVLVHGIRYKKNVIPKEEIYATLKLSIKITPCHSEIGEFGDGATLRPLAAALNPQYQAEMQALGETCKIVVRIYVVQGIHFRPRDRNSQSDAYVKVRMGTKVQSNRAHYVPNQSNPIFGKCFQLEGLLPRDHLLEITVYDRNKLFDVLIGSTIIDIEDRWRTKHRSNIGLANEYCSSGYNKWRDLITPFELLLFLCAKRDIKFPKFVGNRVIIDGETFLDDTQIAKDEDLQERLSLTVLKNLEKLPSFGYKLVPEHVETRSLYRPNCPGVEQGKLQLWVELYESNVNIPPILDITPQPPLNYELRVCVLNCTDVEFSDTNIFGIKMNDIFVRGWCNDFNQSQSTDIHYRSLNGEGNFNWRMIFPFKYSAIEDMMICQRKAGLFETFETKQPAVLYLQVWDNDLLSESDFLGVLEINLASFPQPYSNNRACNEVSLDLESGWRSVGIKKTNDDELGPTNYSTRQSINLFYEKKAKGWFPLHGPMKTNQKNKKTSFAGKIELELEILTELEAAVNPAGLGRNEPAALPPPDRPDTSFNPFLHPLKSMKNILWPILRKYCFGILAVILAILLIGVTILNLPLIMFNWFP